MKSTCGWCDGAISDIAVREETFPEKVALEQRPEEQQLLEGRNVSVLFEAVPWEALHRTLLGE